MPSYDFTTLTGDEFERLVRDLLQRELGVTLEAFATGPDGGIDFRYSRDPNKSFIVQCKHFAASGFSALLSHLTRKEVPKVRALNPARYLLATSVRLTPDNKADIANAFASYIHTHQDIFGADDLNNLLGLFPEVEKQHFKLYLSSIVVLSQVLHSDLYSRAGRYWKR